MGRNLLQFKPRRLLSTLLVIAVGLSAQLAACRQASLPQLETASSSRQPEAPAALPPAPSPAQLEAAARHSAAFIDLRLDGSEFNSLMPNNRVTANGTAADFSPDYSAGGPLADVAFASYVFTTHDYIGSFAGELDFHVNWDVPPPAGQAWLGVYNFTTRRWEWYALTNGDNVNLGAVSADYSSLLSAGTERKTLAIVLMTGNIPASLARVQIGSNILPVPVFVLTKYKLLINTETQLQADGSADVDGTIVKYEFDLYGDGDFIDAGATSVIDLPYERAGSFNTTARVTDNDGGTATMSQLVTVDWVRNIKGDGTQGQATSVLVDSQNNAYLGGIYDAGAASTGLDGLLIKFDPDGNILWRRGLTGPGVESECIADLAFDSAGFLYAAGVVTGDGVVGAPVLLKLNAADAAVVWQKRWSEVIVQSTIALAIDSQDRVNVVASALDADADQAVWVAQVDSDGSELYQRLWDTSASDLSRAVHDADVDAADNLYICGRDNVDVPADLSNGFVASLTATGDLRWAMTEDIEGGEEQFLSLTCSGGQLFVGGARTGAVPPGAGIVASYDLAGNHNWTRYYLDGIEPAFHGACADGADGALLGGSQTSSFGFPPDAVVLHLDAAGTLLSESNYGTLEGDDRVTGAIARGADGAVFLAGLAGSFNWQFTPQPGTSAPALVFTITATTGLLVDGAVPQSDDLTPFADFTPASLDAGGAFVLRHYE